MMKDEKWWQSIRSIATLEIITTFCLLAIKGKIDPKDFALTAGMVITFYYVLKDRKAGDNHVEPNK